MEVYNYRQVKKALKELKPFRMKNAIRAFISNANFFKGCYHVYSYDKLILVINVNTRRAMYGDGKFYSWRTRRLQDAINEVFNRII